jgi:hypothetical protein
MHRLKFITRADLPRDVFYLIDTRYWRASCPLCGAVCCPTRPCPACKNVAIHSQTVEE